MLVLTHRPSERTAIELPDGSIAFVTLVGIDGSDRVRLGFDFPKGMPIYRDEVWRGQLADADERYARIAGRTWATEAKGD